MDLDKNMYDVDSHIAEIYDQDETGTDDVEFIERLIKGEDKIRILEPFCGTGRIPPFASPPRRSPRLAVRMLPQRGQLPTHT